MRNSSIRHLLLIPVPLDVMSHVYDLITYSLVEYQKLIAPECFCDLTNLPKFTWYQKKNSNQRNTYLTKIQNNLANHTDRSRVTCISPFSNSLKSENVLGINSTQILFDCESQSTRKRVFVKGKSGLFHINLILSTNWCFSSQLLRTNKKPWFFSQNQWKRVILKISEVETFDLYVIRTYGNTQKIVFHFQSYLQPFKVLQTMLVSTICLYFSSRNIHWRAVRATIKYAHFHSKSL